MATSKDEIEKHLQNLIGLQLTIARRAADLRNFQFGEIRPISRGSVGKWALHIQCPWRIESADGSIVTGRSDLWKPSSGTNTPIDWDNWDYDEDGNLQDERMRSLLGTWDQATRSAVNATELLFVEDVRADACGGATIWLSGGYRLVLFPAGAAGEDWRIFRPETDEPHFVVSGGSIERQT